MKNRRTRIKIGAGPFFVVPSIAANDSRSAWETAVWKLLINHLVASRRASHVESLLALLITKQERRDIVLRSAVMRRILDGATYREIADELWLSPQTISTFRKALNERHYRSYYERGKTERKKRVWSPGPSSPYDPAKDPSKRRVRTKYGTMYI